MNINITGPTSAATTEAPIDPIKEKNKWLTRADELPESRREPYKIEIQKVFNVASQCLKSIPARSQGIQALASSNASTVQQMQLNANEMFHQYKNYNDGQLAIIQRISSQSATAQMMRLPPSTVPVVMQKKPIRDMTLGQKYLLLGKTLSMVSTQVAADGLKAVERAIETPIKYVFNKAHSAAVVVCDSNETVHKAAKVVKNSVVECAKPVASAVVSLSQWNKHFTDEMAFDDSRKYGIPLDISKQHAMNCTYIASVAATYVALKPVNALLLPVVKYAIVKPVAAVAKPIFKYAVVKPIKAVAKPVIVLAGKSINKARTALTKPKPVMPSIVTEPIAGSGIDAVVTTSPQNTAREVAMYYSKEAKISVKHLSDETILVTVNQLTNTGYASKLSHEALNRIKDFALSGNAKNLIIEAHFINERFQAFCKKKFGNFKSFVRQEPIGGRIAYDRFQVPLDGYVPRPVPKTAIIAQGKSVNIDQRIQYSFNHSPLASGDGGTAIAFVDALFDYATIGKCAKKIHGVFDRDTSARSLKLLGELREKAVKAGAQKLEVHFSHIADPKLCKETFQRLLKIGNQRYKYLGNEGDVYRFEIPLEGSKPVNRVFQSSKTKPPIVITLEEL